MLNTPENIVHFRRCTAIILNILYENFPNPVDIDALYIEDKTIDRNDRALVNFDDEMKSWDEPGNTSEHNPIKNELSIYTSTISFLFNEGYVSCKPPIHGKFQRLFSDCVLTSKGLSALGRTGVKQNINWGDLIHTTIREGKYKALQDLAHKLLSDLLRA